MPEINITRFDPPQITPHMFKIWIGQHKVSLLVAFSLDRIGLNIELTPLGIIALD